MENVRRQKGGIWYRQRCPEAAERRKEKGSSTQYNANREESSRHVDMVNKSGIQSGIQAPKLEHPISGKKFEIVANLNTIEV